jgi:hypothetical protein
MKKLLLPVLLAISISLSAQYTGRMAGIRGGITSGLTYRQYLEDNFSYEGLLSFRKDGMQFTLLRQINEKTLFDISDNLYMVYGYGAHAGFFYDSKYRIFLYNYVTYPERRFSPVVGIDGYGGLEYRFTAFPLVVGLDYKPFFEVSAYQFFKMSIWDMAFSVKYSF